MIQFDENQLEVEVIEMEDSPLVYLFTDEENETLTINLD